ncbi:MAG TPA: MFS transporter [Ktedonobacteraceae bacterium]
MEKMESTPFPRALWILFAGVFVNRFGSFVSVFLILYMISRGYTPTQAGVAVSVYGIGSLGASVLGGYCTDHLGRRNTLLFSMFSSAATMLLLSQVADLRLLIPLVGLAGVTGELYRPAASALIADLVPPARRIRAYALYRFCINLGFAAGPAVAGFLANRSFLLIFVGDALTSFAFGLLVLCALPVDSIGHAQLQRERNGLWQNLRGDYRFLLFLLASLLISFVYFQNQSTFALQVHALGLSDALYGTLISLNGLLIIFLELPISLVTQRLPMRTVIASGLSLIGLGFGLLAFASTLPLLAVTVGVWTLGEMIHSPVSAAYVANLAPLPQRGRYQGIWGLTWGSGLTFAPLLGTLIFAWSATGLWLLCGALGIVAALLLALPLPKFDKTKK